MCSLQLSSFYGTCFCSSSTFFQGYVALQCLKSCWSCRWVRSIFGFMETWKALLGATSAFSLCCRSVQTSTGPLRLDMWLPPAMEDWNFALVRRSKFGRSTKVFFQANSFQNVTLNVNNRVSRISLHARGSRHCCRPLSKAINTWLHLR